MDFMTAELAGKPAGFRDQGHGPFLEFPLLDLSCDVLLEEFRANLTSPLMNPYSRQESRHHQIGRNLIPYKGGPIGLDGVSADAVVIKVGDKPIGGFKVPLNDGL